MPSGRTHEAINSGALAIGAAMYLWFGKREPMQLLQDASAASFCLAYLAGTFLVTPDLDLAAQHVNAKRNWGILGFLWVPYGLLSKHRGMSHSWIIGPAVRAAYLLIAAGMLLWAAEAFGLLNGFAGPWEGGNQEAKPMLLWGTTGYYASQWLHLMADGCWPWTTRAKRRSTKKRRKD